MNEAEAISKILDISLQNYRSSEVLAKNLMFNAAANRLYYAVFQLVHYKAVQDKTGNVKFRQRQKGIHANVKCWLGNQLLKDGIIGREAGKIAFQQFNDLLSLREKSDYEGRIITDEAYCRSQKIAASLYTQFRELFATG